MKRIIAVCAAAILLSGCERSGSVSVPNSVSDHISDLITSSASDPSEVSGLSALNDDSDSSEYSTDDLPDSLVSSPEDPQSSVPGDEKTEIVLCADPLFGRKIVLEGDRLTVTGKGAGLRSIGIFHYNGTDDGEWTYIDFSYDGDRFSAEFSSEGLNDGGLYTVYFYGSDRGNENYRINTASNETIRDVAENNEQAAEAHVEQPLNQVAEYVAAGSDPEEIGRVLTEIKSLSDEICAGLDDDYDKLRAICRWVPENIYYDHDASDEGVPDDSLSLDYLLRNRRSVCGGYSNMTAALCAAQGIECYNVHGGALTDGFSYDQASDDALHEWNFAVIDGRRIWIDSCWNSGNHYQNGEYVDLGSDMYYFDPNGAFLAINHKARYSEHRDYFALLD